MSRAMRPRALCISGGAFHAFYMLGALAAAGMDLSGVRRIAGVSAGAIVGLSVALGIPPRALAEAAVAAGMERLLTASASLLLGSLGLDSGDALFCRVFGVLDSLSGGRATSCCFRDLPVDLRVAACCVDTRSLAVFSREETPGMLVADAVRMSCTVPVIMAPVRREGLLYVDGCLVDPFPTSLLDASDLRRPSELFGVLVLPLSAGDRPPGRELSGYLMDLLSCAVRMPRPGDHPWALERAFEAMSTLEAGGVTGAEATELFEAGEADAAAFISARAKKNS